jgi:hypothetical protein
MQDKAIVTRANWRAVSWLTAALLGATALGGCAVAPVGPVYTSGYYDDGAVVANVAPPTPYMETIPVAPFAGAIWIGGFWDWSSGRHVWRPGHYERPRPGFSYRQPSWTHGSDGRWMLHRGGWDHGRGR